MIPRRCYGCQRIRWRTIKCPGCARRLCSVCADPVRHTKPVTLVSDYSPVWGEFEIPTKRSRCERWRDE